MKWSRVAAVLSPLMIAGPLMITGMAHTLVAAAVAMGATPAVAGESRQEVGARVGKPLQEAQRLAEQKSFKAAMAKVQEAAGVAGKSPYEEKLVNEFAAFVAMKAGDYAAAATASEALIERGLVSGPELAQRLKAVIQLNYQLKEYGKVERFGTRLLQVAGDDPEIAQLMAQARYLRRDYAGAEQLLAKLIEGSATPRQDWLTLRVASLQQLKRPQEVMAALEVLLARYPDNRYWTEIFAYLMNEAGQNDRQTLEVFRLKQQTVGLVAEEYVEMAELALALGQYGEALAVLERGFASGAIGSGEDAGRDQRLLALAKTESATDQAGLELLAGEAAAATSGEPAVRVGEAYMNYGQYDKAAALIVAGLGKGGVTSQAEAQLHLGIALLNRNDADAAAAAFRQIPAESPLSRLGRLWLVQDRK